MSATWLTRTQGNNQKRLDCIFMVYGDNFFVVDSKAAQASQLYMAEAASPLLWIGRVRGSFRLESHGSATVNLVIAVPRAGAYSLARGLQISSTKIASPSAVHEASVEENAAVYSSKLEFTLVVEGRDI